MLNKKSYSNKWMVLAISFMLMLSFAISLQSLPQIFDKIQGDISFSQSQAGILMGAYAIPGVILPFLIAILASRYNKKSIIIISLLIMILGLVAFSMSGAFSTLLTYRLVTGIGATALVVLAPLNTAVPFATVVATNLFGVLGERMDWRTIILGIAGFIGLILATTIFSLQLPKEEEEVKLESEPEGSLGGLLSNGSLWILALIWTLGNAQLLSYVTFVPQYFQNTGMTMQRAGLITSFIMLVPIFLGPVIGITIDKTGWKKRIILVGAIIMTASFILISRGNLPLPLLGITLGIGFTPIPIFVFSSLPEVVKPHEMGMGLGILTAASNLGIAIGPSAFGFLLDKTGSNFNLGFMILAGASLVIILALRGLKTQTA